MSLAINGILMLDLLEIDTGCVIFGIFDEKVKTNEGFCVRVLCSFTTAMPLFLTLVDTSVKDSGDSEIDDQSEDSENDSVR